MIVGWEVEKVKAGAIVGLLMVPIIEEVKKEEGEVNRGNEKPPLVGGEKQVRLLPGFNYIPDEIWDKIKIHLIDKILNKQIIYISKREKNEETGDFTEEGIPLEKMSLEKAREVVWNCYDLESLKLWKFEIPDGKEIRGDILAQMEGIIKGVPPEERERKLGKKR